MIEQLGRQPIDIVRLPPEPIDHQGLFDALEMLDAEQDDEAYALAELAAEDPDFAVRTQALELIAGIWVKNEDYEAAAHALERLQDEHVVQEDFLEAGQTGQRIGWLYWQAGRQLGNGNGCDEEAQGSNLQAATALEIAETWLEMAYDKEAQIIADKDKPFVSAKDTKRLDDINFLRINVLYEQLAVNDYLFNAEARSDDWRNIASAAHDVSIRAQGIESKRDDINSLRDAITGRAESYGFVAENNRKRKRWGGLGQLFVD